MKNVFSNSLFNNIYPKLGGGIFYLLFPFFLCGQPTMGITDCTELQVEICEITSTPSPIGCFPACQNSVSCKQFVYQVILSSNNIPDGFCLNYKEITIDIGIDSDSPFAGANQDATTNCNLAAGAYPLTFSSRANPRTDIVTLTLDDDIAQKLCFNNGQVHLFDIVVDGFPEDVFNASCIFTQYINGEIPNQFICESPSNPATNGDFDCSPALTDTEVEIPLTSGVENDIFLKLGQTAGNLVKRVPVNIKTSVQGASSILVSYADFKIEVDGENLMNAPTLFDFLSATNPNVPDPEYSIEPSVNGQDYVIHVRYPNGFELPNPVNNINLFDVRLKGPINSSEFSKAIVTILDARIEYDGACTLPKLTTNTRTREAEFGSFLPCADVTLDVQAISSSSNSTTCEVLTQIGFLWNGGPRDIDEIKVVVKFELDNGLSLTSVIDNGDYSAKGGCLGSSNWYTITNENTLEYCLKDLFPVNLDAGRYMTLHFTGSGGCVRSATITNAYIDFDGNPAPCIPTINNTGFPRCTPELEIVATFEDNNAHLVNNFDVEIDGTTAQGSIPCDKNLNINSPYGECVCDDGTYVVTPSNNNYPTNGVNTFDLLLIQKHLLGTFPLSSPYKIIAADVNRSGSITPTDILEGRRLLLGVIPSFPNMNTSWRFVDKSFVFPNQLNPFSTVFPEDIEVNVVSFVPDKIADFVAIKTGDIDGTANLSQRIVQEDNHALGLEMSKSKKGDILYIPFVLEDDGEALQACLSFNPNKLNFLDIIPGDIRGIDPGSFGKQDINRGLVRFAWFRHQKDEHTNLKDRTLFYLVVRAKEDILSPFDLISIDSEKMPNLFFDKNGVASKLLLSTKEGVTERTFDDKSGLSIQVSPNPISEAMMISLKCKVESPAKIWVFDAYGRRVFYHELSFVGTYNLVIDEANQWSSGAYKWIVSTPKGQSSGSLIKL